MSHSLEHTYPVAADEIWRLWTMPQGIESWWAPDGFAVEVTALDLQPGGRLVYTMTATGAQQIEFMQSAGLPLATTSQKTFTEVEPPSRLAYSSLVDFVPDVEPYEFLTVVELHPVDEGVRVVMTVEPLHDEVWTERLLAGRRNELDNLARVIAASS